MAATDEPMTDSISPLITVVDDDIGLLRGLARLLPAWGYRVRTYSNPSAALVAIEQEPPDALLLDIYMPELDGFEVLAHIRKLPVKFPIVAMSGDTVGGTLTNMLTIFEVLGVATTLTKPIPPEELKAVLERILEPAPDSST